MMEVVDGRSVCAPCSGGRHDMCVINGCECRGWGAEPDSKRVGVIATLWARVLNWAGLGGQRDGTRRRRGDAK